MVLKKVSNQMVIALPLVMQGPKFQLEQIKD